jgi:hypothetical protein
MKIFNLLLSCTDITSCLKEKINIRGENVAVLKAKKRRNHSTITNTIW